jgi:hypothetical protein
MYGPYPVVFAPAIRNHYMKLERFRPESSPLTQDSAEQSIPPLDAQMLLQKARAAMNDRGLTGLLKDSWQYLRWRITISQSNR